MKNAAIYLLTSMLLCIGCKGNQVQQAASSIPIAERTISIDNNSLEQGICDTLDLGRLHSGEIVAKSIRIENKSDQPLVLMRHQVSCGCLSVDFDRKPIPTGASSQIKLEFDSRTMNGLQLKTLSLFFAEKELPMRIFVEAEVE